MMTDDRKNALNVAECLFPRIVVDAYNRRQTVFEVGQSVFEGA